MNILVERRLITAARWSARVIGTALCGLVAALAIGEGMHNPLQGSLPEILLTFGFLTMFVGQIVAWRSEGRGGSLILCGFVIFAFANCGVPVNVVYVPWVASGLLYLACSWRTPKAIAA